LAKHKENVLILT